LGLRPTNWVNPFELRGQFGHGFDDVLEDAAGNLWVVEYKGNTGKLAKDQMERRWVRQKIDELLRDAPDSPWGKKLDRALRPGKLRGIAVHSTDGPSGTTTIVGTWTY
jgi:hypothetical protein